MIRSSLWRAWSPAVVLRPFRPAQLSLVALAMVPAQASAATLALNPVADAVLYEDAAGTTANGAGEFLLAGRTNQTSNSRRRSLLRFDASTLPVDAVITGVSLRLFLFAVTTADTDLQLHRLTRPWTEGPADPAGNESGGATALAGDATWRHARFDQSLWTSPGGDAADDPSATLRAGTESGFLTWTGPGLTADLTVWLADPSLNAGWLLRDGESVPQTAKRFASGDHADPALRPVLTIDYEIIPEPSAASLMLAASVLLRRRTRPANRS
jgi:hypothetical protein